LPISSTSDSAVTERTLLASEDCDVFGVTTEMKQSVVCWSVKPVGEPDAGNPHVRFDEREVETEHGRRILRHRGGNPDPEVSRSLTHRATSRLYPPPPRANAIRWGCRTAWGQAFVQAAGPSLARGNSPSTGLYRPPAQLDDLVGIPCKHGDGFSLPRTARQSSLNGCPRDWLQACCHARLRSDLLTPAANADWRPNPPSLVAG